MLAEAVGLCGPMDGGPPDSLQHVGRQGGVVLHHRGGAGHDAAVAPVEGLPGARWASGFVGDEVGEIEARPGLDHHDVDTLAGELVGERAAAGARSDDHDRLLLVVEFAWKLPPSADLVLPRGRTPAASLEERLSPVRSKDDWTGKP